MIRTICVVAFVLGLGWVAAGAAAQQATPSDGFVTPDPASCRIEPRTVDDLLRFLATPVAGDPAATPGAMPEGEPADAEVVSGVTVTLEEIYACYNANAFLRVFAFYTDGYLSRSLTAADINPEALSLFATPIAPQAPNERISISVESVVVLADGRVAAYVVTRSPLGDGADSPAWYIFVEKDGAYWVDDVILLPAGGDAATPAAG
jgi:hypothetical protein